MYSQLTNNDRLFFFAAFSCEVGRFDNHIGTLSADLVLLPKTGAIASFAASRVSGGGSNTSVARRLMQNLLTKNSNNEYNSIGVASRITKSNPTDLSNENFMYILMGDPSLRLIHPPLECNISAINNELVKDITDPIELKGMKYLNIKGHISSNIDNSLISDFNGTINIMLNEPNIDATVIDEFGTKFNFVKNGATLNSSIFPIVNGEYDADLFIPGDISFSSKKSILYLYATDKKQYYAKGIYNNIIINDIEDATPPSPFGPSLIVKFDSRLFKCGDTVSRNPLLIVDI